MLSTSKHTTWALFHTFRTPSSAIAVYGSLPPLAALCDARLPGRAGLDNLSDLPFALNIFVIDSSATSRQARATSLEELLRQKRAK